MSRTLEASIVMPIALLCTVFLLMQLILASGSCYLLARAATSLEMDSLKVAGMIDKREAENASSDLFSEPYTLKRYYVNSACVNYLALFLIDDINALKKVFKDGVN